MHAYYCDHFVLPLPPNHRFPMEKYRLLRQRVARDLPAVEMYVPSAAKLEDLTRIHTPAYVHEVVQGRLSDSAVRRIGFPWSPALVERSRRSVGGTMAAARQALVEGAAANLAGGTHHAFRDRGEGFCVFNDVAVSVSDLQADGQIERAAVVDLDVHQGNGTAEIFKTDSSVFTASVHGANNYPFRKALSDLDIPLPDGADDRQYLDATAEAVDAALATRPDLVYYVAGADAYQGDVLGRLSVSKRGLASRDDYVVSACALRGVPLVVVMSGGYAAAVRDTVDIHFRSIQVLFSSTRRAA